MTSHKSYLFVRLNIAAALIVLSVIAPITFVQASIDPSISPTQPNLQLAPPVREYVRLDKSFNGTGFRTDTFGGGVTASAPQRCSPTVRSWSLGLADGDQIQT